jgi:hypothetical protein
MSQRPKPADRRYFIGGSDARVIVGDNEGALLRLWREKRGEVEPEDLSDNLNPQRAWQRCANPVCITLLHLAPESRRRSRKIILNASIWQNEAK